MARNKVIIARDHHNISRNDISSNAIKVLYRLSNAGFDALLVGGAVRDLLLGIRPKDFDIATNATPEQVRKLFRNAILIGRRFRLAHINFRHETIEVATFRGDTKHQTRSGMIVRDNVYGTLEEDAWRRDFTVNALYYNIKDFSLIDYTGGLKDIKKQLIRSIGKPSERYREDPVRMLRAIRLAAKLNLNLASSTQKPILKLGHLILDVPTARLLDECIKWFLSTNSYATFKLLQQLNLFATLFPQTETVENQNQFNSLLKLGFSNTDQRFAIGKTINPAFLFAVILWWPLQQRIKQLEKTQLPLFSIIHKAMHEIIQQQKQIISLPQRFINTIKSIWILQYRLERYEGKKASRVFTHPRFRAAYDFLQLRAESGEQGTQELATWWQKYKER